MDKFGRIVQKMSENKWDGLVLSSVHSIRYLTGIAVDLETGPNALDAGPMVLFIEKKGDDLRGHLLAPDGFEEEVQHNWIECITYENYNIESDDFDRHQSYLEAIGKWKSLITPNMKLAVEKGWVPYGVADQLNTNNTEDCTNAIHEIRQIKDSEEIEALRASLKLANVGQRAIRSFIKEGLQEIEMLGLVKSEIEKEAGHRVPLLADFVTGSRTSEIGGPPSSRKIRSGELLLADLVPCLNGYWGDSCTVTSTGSISSRMEKVFRIVLDALELGKSLIKPGMLGKELDRQVRQYIEKHQLSYPHHTGHGLGVQYHEGPFITPNSDSTLRENMVIALEPGAYLEQEGFGIRLEHCYLVTSSGCEQLTEYEMAL